LQCVDRHEIVSKRTALEHGSLIDAPDRVLRREGKRNERPVAEENWRPKDNEPVDDRFAKQRAGETGTTFDEE
jgi:hypothetical protein